MGKKQHQKDKLYLTCTEWSTLYGGKKSGRPTGEQAGFRRLPFNCCSLSLQPFEHPYCTKEGVLFDLVNVLPFLKKFGVNPVTGEKMVAKDLIKLHFHKDSQGKHHCPVTFKVFNENTHIVCVGSTGNVFAYEIIFHSFAAGIAPAPNFQLQMMKNNYVYDKNIHLPKAVERLNIKPAFWKDLLTDEPFLRKDLITIQDPTSLGKFDFTTFYHLKKNLKVEDERELMKDPRYCLKAVNSTTQDILNELDSTYKAPQKEVTESKKADAVNAAHYSTGKVSAAFTSTAISPETSHEAAIINDDILRYERVKKKAYIRLKTSCGILNLELHSDILPKTCENFLKHCATGYYQGTIFHRSIRNFMIQGGDPDGDGTGGKSIWENPFKDEFKTNLTHTGRGILSMANSGPNTNKSQFFITYRSARHLDGKHTVFGRVVGGLETLDKMERIETDKKDKPKKDIVFEEATVFVNPYDEAEEQLSRERSEALNEEKDTKAPVRPGSSKAITDKRRVFTSGVGKYINPATRKNPSDSLGDISSEPKKKKKMATGFGNFSNW